MESGTPPPPLPLKVGGISSDTLASVPLRFGSGEHPMILVNDGVNAMAKAEAGREVFGWEPETVDVILVLIHAHHL